MNLGSLLTGLGPALASGFSHSAVQPREALVCASVSCKGLPRKHSVPGHFLSETSGVGLGRDGGGSRLHLKLLHRCGSTVWVYLFAYLL